MSESRVDLIVSGGETFDPDMLSEYIKFQPDNTWRVGEKIGSSLITRKENAWVISTGYSLINDVCELLEVTMDRLSPVKDKLCEFLGSRDDVDIQASIVIYVSDDIPILNFNPRIISTLSFYGASLDVDVIFEE